MALHSRQKISGTEILEALKRNSNSVSADRVWLRLAWSKFGVGKKLALPLKWSRRRESRRGLWADPQPVPPWMWRKR